MRYVTFLNFYQTTLGAALSSTATTMPVSSTTGLPSSLASGQFIPMTLTPDSSPGSAYEIVYVTGISGSTLTVTRGEEGTSALSWNVGDILYSTNTAGTTAPLEGPNFTGPVTSAGLITANGGIDVSGGTAIVPPATASNQAVNLGQMPYLTLEQFGGKADGVTDNTSAYLSAVAALPSTGGKIVLGSGTYLFDSAVSFSFPASSYGLTITGQGSGATTVFFKGGINGFSFKMNSPQNYIHFNGFSVTTDNSSTTNTVTAIEISQSVPEGSFLQSSFVDISIYGNSGPANGEFWSYGIYANGVSDINFINDIFYGTGGNSIGIFLTGNTSVSPYYGIVFNITSCGFFGLNTGLVYGSYIQGVTVSQSNFTNCEYGIANDSNNIGNDQLAINNSQFNVAETAINLQGNLNDLLLTGNMIIVGTSTSSFGVFLSTGIRATIVGNDFEQGSGSTVGNTGIIVSGAFTVGVVTGNVFQNLTYGVSLGTSTSGWNVQANVYNKVTTTVTNSGSGNSIGVATD